MTTHPQSSPESVPVVAVLGYLYWDSLGVLFSTGSGVKTIAMASLFRLISGFLIWRSRHRLLQLPKEQRWWGPAVIVFGLVLYWSANCPHCLSFIMFLSGW